MTSVWAPAPYITTGNDKAGVEDTLILYFILGQEDKRSETKGERRPHC